MRAKSVDGFKEVQKSDEAVQLLGTRLRRLQQGSGVLTENCWADCSVYEGDCPRRLKATVGCGRLLEM